MHHVVRCSPSCRAPVPPPPALRTPYAAAVSACMRCRPSSLSIVKVVATCRQGGWVDVRVDGWRAAAPASGGVAEPARAAPPPSTPARRRQQQNLQTSSMLAWSTWLPFMICSTVTSLEKGRSGSSLGVSRKHCGVPSLRAGRGGSGRGWAGDKQAGCVDSCGQHCTASRKMGQWEQELQCSIQGTRTGHTTPTHAAPRGGRRPQPQEPAHRTNAAESNGIGQVQRKRAASTGFD